MVQHFYNFQTEETFKLECYLSIFVSDDSILDPILVRVSKSDFDQVLESFSNNFKVICDEKNDYQNLIFKHYFYYKEEQKLYLGYQVYERLENE